MLRRLRHVERMNDKCLTNLQIYKYTVDVKKVISYKKVRTLSTKNRRAWMIDCMDSEEAKKVFKDRILSDGLCSLSTLLQDDNPRKPF